MQKINILQKQIKQCASEQNFAHYFAGLWPGDGNVALKADRQKITLHITMSLEQSPFLEALLSSLRLKLKDYVGSVSLRPDNNSAVLNIVSLKGLTWVVNSCHGKCLSPKVYALNKLSLWLRKNGAQVPKKLNVPVPFCSQTAWLAGFVDADGSFGLDLRYHPRVKVVCQFQMNQSLLYRTTKLSYEPLFEALGNYLHIKLRKIKEKKSGRVYLVLKGSSAKTKNVLQTYFKNSWFV